MKFKEKLAKEYVRGQTCEVMDTYKSHEESYLAGFDMARTLASAQVQINPHVPPETNCLEYRIAHLGEFEVSKEEEDQS